MPDVFSQYLCKNLNNYSIQAFHTNLLFVYVLYSSVNLILGTYLGKAVSISKFVYFEKTTLTQHPWFQTRNLSQAVSGIKNVRLLFMSKFLW